MNARRWVMISVCYVVWCCFNWVPGLQALLIGIPAAIFVGFLTEKIPVSVMGHHFFEPKRLAIFLFRYLPVFWWEHFKANLDVARRVLSPGMPICPAVVRVKVRIRTDMGITLLANSLSLVPGTTSVDLDQEKGLIYVHCMAVDPKDVEGSARRKVERFENILLEVFE